jgi:hypothetical protein
VSPDLSGRRISAVVFAALSLIPYDDGQPDGFFVSKVWAGISAVGSCKLEFGSNTPEALAWDSHATVGAAQREQNLAHGARTCGKIRFCHAESL